MHTMGLSMEYSNVSVAILTCNDWSRTLDCLAAVHAQTTPIKRIVVCDNGSGNEVADYILKGWRSIADRYGMDGPVELFGDDNTLSPLVLLRREENEGAARGINSALRFLLYDQECQAFWLLHNDVIPEPYALEALLHHTVEQDRHGKERISRIGIVGSTLLRQDTGLLQCAGGGVWSKTRGNVHLLDEGIERFALSDHDDIARKMDFACGASCLVLRQLIEDIGLYDESLYQFLEDVEYGLRAKKSGWNINWAPGALVRHHAPNADKLTPVLAFTENPELSREADYTTLRNRFYLLRKYSPFGLISAFALLPFVLWSRFCKNQKQRLRLLLHAAYAGSSMRMGYPSYIRTTCEVATQSE